MHKGDTVQVQVNLTNNGEPFVPDTEQVVFAVGRTFGGNPLFSVAVVDGAANITHEMTRCIPVGKYKFDVRVYTKDKTLVATPCYGDFELLEVVNNEL